MSSSNDKTGQEVYHFRTRPGPRERQLQRRNRNPLFAPGQRVTQRQVNEARADDLAEFVAFEEALRTLVQKAIDLDSNVESDVILEMKAEADRLYEQGAGLGGQNEEPLDHLKQLTKVIMASVWKGAGNDTTAHAELRDEEAAREAHYALLAFPVISHLLRPEPCIPEDELTQSLLSESAEAVTAAMGIFQDEQQLALISDATNRVEALRNDSGKVPDNVLAVLAAMLAVVRPH